MFTTYQQAIDHLYTLTSSGKIFSGAAGIKRTRALLELLGNPQNQLKVIHIAGTSGKGSTAYTIANLFHAHNLKVGLTVSPHINDIRERFQINLKLLPEQKMLAYISKIIDVAQPLAKTELGIPTYFEIVSIIAFYIFAEEKVDYAIIETGFGGLLDATNTIDRSDKVCVITPIDFDHQHILGNTLPEIAAQKAGIIGPNNVVFSSQQQPEAQNVLQAAAQKQNATIEFIINSDIAIQEISLSGTQFIYPFVKSLQNITTTLIGQHQAYNTALALRASEYVLTRDHISINQTAMETSLINIQIPGRFEVKKLSLNTSVILDGAHNPHKMEAFTTALMQIFPHQKINFLIAFKKSKDFIPMLQHIIPLAEHITITTFFFNNPQLGNLATEPTEIAQALTKLSFLKFTSIPDPQEALSYVQANNSNNHPIIVTGSFYLVSDISQILNTKY